VLFIVFKSAAFTLEKIAHVTDAGKADMRNSLLVADLAAISASTGINYVPDFCWQPHLPPQERTVRKFIYGRENWKNSFYSYIYNVDPSVGLFQYNTSAFTAELSAAWLNAVARHPVAWLQYHGGEFWNLLTNHYFNMGLWSGLRTSHRNNAALALEKTGTVDSFLETHSTRFSYKNGSIVLEDDSRPITPAEENALLALAGESRQQDVLWMKWYSHVPRRVYNVTNYAAEDFVEPFFESFRWNLKYLSILATYLVLLFLLLFLRSWIFDSFYKFSFTILCVCGILHLFIRFFFLTDPVFRFGILSVLFTFFAIIILIADRLNKRETS
jgi:hypothetical protein